ncbi:hypothetical protein [Alkanindiges illinoisensis]|uniref:hypothetical protein n=1 Tax=Alkanindiges illinoisensis TaxID=197183 RepID=UPI000479EC17|nr:hypothetical protein [Alkanindiges illinoisensis]
MVALAASGERKFVRYKQQDVDAVYIRGNKIYGKNLWQFPNSGSASSAVYGEWVTDYLSADNQHQIQRYVKRGTQNIQSLKQWTGLSPINFVDLNKSYSFQCKVKSSLQFVRLFVYIYGQTNPVTAFKVGVNNTTFTDVQLASLVPNGSATNTAYRGVVFLGWYTSDFNNITDTAYFEGHTIEVKEMKLEEGELSPYSIHSSLL